MKKRNIKKKPNHFLLFSVSHTDFSVHFVQTKTLEVLQFKLDIFVTCKSGTTTIWSASVTSSGREKIISSWSNLGENWTQNSSHPRALKRSELKQGKSICTPSLYLAQTFSGSSAIAKHSPNTSCFLYQSKQHYWVKFSCHHFTAA